MDIHIHSIHMGYEIHKRYTVIHAKASSSCFEMQLKFQFKPPHISTKSSPNCYSNSLTCTQSIPTTPTRNNSNFKKSEFSYSSLRELQLSFSNLHHFPSNHTVCTKLTPKDVPHLFQQYPLETKSYFGKLSFHAKLSLCRNI